MIKKTISIVMTVVMIMMVAAASYADTRAVSGTMDIKTDNTYAIEVAAQSMSSGSYQCKIALNSIHYNTSASYSFYEIAYRSGVTIVDRTFTSTGYSTRHYSLPSTKTMYFSVENNVSGVHCTATVGWDFDY